MGSMSVRSRTLCLTLEVVNEDIWCLDRKRLQPKELLWQQQRWCNLCFWDGHSWCQVLRTLLLYFQRYRLFSFYHFSVAVLQLHRWSNLHNRKTSKSPRQKKIFQIENRDFSVYRKALQISRNYFYLIYTLITLAIWYFVMFQARLSFVTTLIGPFTLLTVESFFEILLKQCTLNTALLSYGIAERFPMTCSCSLKCSSHVLASPCHLCVPVDKINHYCLVTGHETKL